MKEAPNNIMLKGETPDDTIIVSLDKPTEKLFYEILQEQANENMICDGLFRASNLIAYLALGNIAAAQKDRLEVYIPDGLDFSLYTLRQLYELFSAMKIKAY